MSDNLLTNFAKKTIFQTFNPVANHLHDKFMVQNATNIYATVRATL